MKFLKLFILVLLATACAIQSAPEGGPQDEEPPQIVKSTPPNKQTNFTAEEIILEFNEFIQLKNFSGQFYSSPPLKNRVDYKLKGKKLYLYLQDTLLPNTTYTFSFGAAIEDITESNVQANYKYVFSTGSVLDSLSIGGNVQDAYTGLPQENMVAMLYKKGTPDSALLSQRPLYYTITDQAGNFKIENLAQDTFKLVVMADENLNLIYDADVEKGGFAQDDVVAGQALEKPIRLYKTRNAVTLLEAKQQGFGKVLFSFTGNVSNPSFTIVGSDALPNKRGNTAIEFAGGGDTVYYWFNAKEYPPDVNFLLFNVKADSLQVDSVRVLMKKLNAPKLEFTVLNAEALSPLDTVTLESSQPITSIETSLLRLMRDSVAIPFTVKNQQQRSFELHFEKEEGQRFLLYTDSAAITDMFSGVNDSGAYQIKVANEADMAILKVLLVAEDTTTKIFELINDQNQVIKRKRFTKELLLNMDYVKPGKYGVRIIWDTNNNGQWDGGNYVERLQPEYVMYYPKPVELRANWELEVDWEIPDPFFTKEKTAVNAENGD